jgi:hypothetical protein
VDSLDAEVSAEVLAAVGLELYHAFKNSNNFSIIFNSSNIEK